MRIKRSIQRREFLAGAMATGLAAGFGRPAVATTAPAPGPNETIRVACVGVRGQGRIHINEFEKTAGVHEMDMARWGLGVELPTRIHGAGGHFLFDDDQETPNTLICTFEYPAQQKMLVFETRHWITNHEGFVEGANNEVGVTFYGSEGYMQVKYFDYRTYLGKQREPGPSGQGAPDAYERFIAGVRSRRHDDLGVEIEDGHLSSALCHLGNISYRLKRSLEFDPQTETFGTDEAANALLSRDYRAPYVVPRVDMPAEA
jgi:hypothetical protein